MARLTGTLVDGGDLSAASNAPSKLQGNSARRWAQLRRRFNSFLVVNFVVSALFTVAEGTGPINGLYYAVITSTKIGYGDVVPTTEYLRALAIFYTAIARL